MNSKEIEKVFVENRPHITCMLLHKHVPIQELHHECSGNKLGGTLNLIELSNNFNVDKFVLVSTDKAVNPVNVMGATSVQRN